MARKQQRTFDGWSSELLLRRKRLLHIQADLFQFLNVISGDSASRRSRPSPLPTATASPEGAALLDLPHLDAFEGPLGAHRHVDVALPVGVEALAGGRTLGSHRPAGVESPHLGRT